MAKPTGESDLEPRVEQLELTVAALSEQVQMLEERVLTLEEEGAPIEPPIEPPGELLTIEFSGSVSLTFDEADAIDLGDYEGEYVRQACEVVVSGPWAVYFRPDVNFVRDEIVVEYGCRYGLDVKPATCPTPAHILEPYTATIKRGEEVVATVEVPKHYWAARWRWQSAPRPQIRTLADLVAMRALPPMTEAGLSGGNNTVSHVEYAGPMTRGGLQAAMGATGDRPELGPTTEHQAIYLVANDADGEVTMRTQAECAGTMGLHIRDEDTGAPLDVQKYPYHGLNLGTTTLPKPPNPAGDPNYFVLDCAHFGALTFVPWLLTDDPYLLEECQFGANYHCIESAYHQSVNKLPGMAQPSQARGWAWGVRDIARMAAFSPERPPSWLLPRSAFAANLDDCFAFANNYLSSQTPSCSVFSCMTQGNIISSWMIGFNACVVGWMKWSGYFPDWDGVASYVLRTILELNAPPEAGGWDRRWPAPYSVNVLGLRKTTDTQPSPLGQDMQYKPSPLDAETPTSWGECWELYQKWCNAQPHQKALGEGWTEDKVYENAVDYPYGQSNVAAPSAGHYQGIQRAGLASAALAGETGAYEAHQWLSSKMPAVVQTYGNHADYRYTHWPE
jgi:hypothetical protein